MTLVLVHIPAVPLFLAHVFSLTGAVPSPGPIALDVSTLATLSGLTSRLNLGRRFFRVFRFLDAFNSAYVLSTSNTNGLSLDSWLTVSAHSFNGMYFLLETLTFPDVLGVPGVNIWGAEWGKVLRVESQRFWLFALVCGATAGALKVKGGGVEGRKRYRTLRKMVANVLDVPLPGVVVGWVPVSDGTVGVCMLLSTWLTASEVWEGCGEQVDEELKSSKDKIAAGKGETKEKLVEQKS